MYVKAKVECDTDLNSLLEDSCNANWSRSDMAQSILMASVAAVAASVADAVADFVFSVADLAAS